MGLKEDNAELKDALQESEAERKQLINNLKVIRGKLTANYKQGKANGIKEANADHADALKAAAGEIEALQEALRNIESDNAQLRADNLALEHDLENCLRGKASN